MVIDSRMPRIAAIGRALPPYKLTQAEVARFACEHFDASTLDLERLRSVFNNANIDSRYFSVPAEWFQTDKSLVDKNQIYIESCDTLGAVAVRECLQNAGVSASDVDYIIFVSTTGLATPSIDARLINRLGMRSDIRRTPIWGLGCAGGAAGLSHAYHHLLGHPRERVLVVAAEFCGLTFQHGDMSKSNFVAMALFGEGVAAVLLTGGEVGGDGPSVLGTRSTFWPDSLDVMGWNVMNTGMQVVFNQKIPDIVASLARPDVDAFLAAHGFSLGDVSHFILHPGGAKVIEAYGKALGLFGEQLDIGRQILREYGNMSSVTVLFVLAETLSRGTKPTGELGLISALGPGFCAESLLVRF